MQNPSAATPEGELFTEIIRMDPSEVVGSLTEILGQKLVAYLAGVKEIRAVREWMGEDRPIRDVNAIQRLNVALRAQLLKLHDSNAVVQAWFQGLNPYLGDKSLLQILRDEAVNESGPQVLAAARYFSELE